MSDTTTTNTEAMQSNASPGSAAGSSTTTDPGQAGSTESEAVSHLSAVPDVPAAASQPKPERQPGPMTTRTGAKALVIEAPKGTRVFTAGGDKGGKIAELLQTKPEMSRKDIAALVGCSQSRVAEVARVLGIAQARPKTEAEAAEAPAEAQETVNA